MEGPTLTASPRPALPGGALLSKLGHELRGPLSGIQGLTRIMRTNLASGRGAPDRLDRQLELIGHSATDLLRTVEQVVELARLDLAPTLDGDGFDCRAVVAETAGGWSPAAAEHGRQLVVRVPGTPVLAAGDAATLERILAELFDNALKYAEPGEIGVDTRYEGETPVVEISDPGPGIAEEEQALIFEPFTRGAAADRAEVAGSGLGLHLAERLAGRIGAHLGLRSSPGGSTFAVRLSPARPVAG